MEQGQTPLTAEQLRSYEDLAELIYDKSEILFKELASEAKRAESAKDMMSAALAAGRDRAAVDETKRAFDQLGGLQCSVYSAIAARVVELTRLGGPGENPHLPRLEDARSGGELAAKRFNLLEFGLANIRFFHGQAVASLHASIAKYIGLCEAFLGHKIGSHDAAERIAPVLRELALAVGGLFIPPVGFIDAGVEIIRQAGNTPGRVAAEDAIRDADGMDRHFLLWNSLGAMAKATDFDDGIVNTSVDAVLQSRNAFAEGLRDF